MLKRESANGGLEALSVKIKSLDGINTKVGWKESSVYESGEKVAMIASENEEGDISKNRPPRPFMRNAVIKNKNKWLKIGGIESLKVLKGEKTIKETSEVIGIIAEADCRQSIVDFTNPALSPSTIKARLSKRSNKKKVGLLTKPLEDSGYMLATLTHTTD